MNLLNATLTGGQQAPFDQSYHNDLVAKLQALERSAQIELQTSATQVLVHPELTQDGNDANDYPLVPDEVAVSDATSWGLPGESAIKIQWTLESGPGHIETAGDTAPHNAVETAPSDTVFWSWDRDSNDSYYDARPQRAWDAIIDGRNLPSAVKIKAEAKALTLETNGSPVDQQSGLSSITGAVDGEKRLVRDEAAIYIYDSSAGSWSKSQDVSPGDYALISSKTETFLVGRAYDPAAQPGVVPKLDAHQDVVYMSAEGTASVSFDDFTTTGQEGSAERTITAKLQNGDGSNVSVSGQHLDEDDIVGVDDNDLRFTATATAPGLLVVEAEYNTGGETKTTTRAVRVRPSLDTKLGATTDPSLPPLDINAGKGQITANIGQEVLPQNAVDQGPVFDEGAKNNWTNARARELTRRLGVEDLTDSDPQVQMLYEAGALLVSALHQPTENGLHRYQIDLPAGHGSTGQVLLFGSEQGALRLRQKVGADASEGQLQTWTAVGFLEDPTTLSSAHLTGNGSVFEVEIKLAYGTASDENFPEETFHHVVRVRPGQDQAQLTLPRELPDKPSDRWHMSYRVAARWPEGREVQSEFTPWSNAEVLPQTAASAELVTSDNGPALSISTDGTPHGLVQWGQQGSSPITDQDVAGAEALPTRLPVSPAPQTWNGPTSPPHLYVKLLQLAPAGSSRGQIESFDLTLPTDQASEALPLAEVPGNAIPEGWPVVTGMLLKGDTRNWIGIDDSYVMIGGGATGLVDRIDVVVDGTVTELQPQSPVEYESNIQFFSVENNIEIRLHTVGAVDTVDQLATDLSLLRPQSTAAFNKEGGYFTQTLQVPTGAYGAEDRLLYRVGAGPDKQLIELKLGNSSIDTNSGPDVLTVDPLIDGAPNIETTVDRSVSPEEWTLKLQDGSQNWQDAYVTVSAESLAVAELSSAETAGGTGIDISGSDFRVQTGTTPQRVFLHLTDAAFKNKDATAEILLKSGTSDGAPQSRVKIHFQQA